MHQSIIFYPWKLDQLPKIKCFITKIFMKIFFQLLLIFFNLSTKSTHFNPLQGENCGSNLWLVVDWNGQVNSGLNGLNIHNLNKNVIDLANLLLISHSTSAVERLKMAIDVVSTFRDNSLAMVGVDNVLFLFSIFKVHNFVYSPLENVTEPPT